MAASGKNRRAGRGPRHLIDVSDLADSREPRDAWLADSSSTLTEQRPLATSGKVEIWIEPEEYEEYSRLKNGLAPDGSQPTGDSDTPPDLGDENPADGRGQDVAAFMAHINTAPAPEADTRNGAEGEDEFLAQFTHTPRRSPAPPPGRPGSAALEGVTAARGRSDRPARAERRVRGGGWRRWASLAGVVVVLAGVASVLLQSHTPTRTPNSSSVTSPARPDPYANFSATLSAIDHQVRSVADNAVSQERVAAAERRATARELADRRRAAATARAARTRTGHRTPAVSQTTARLATTASPVSAPTQTVTVATPTATTPERSTSSTTSNPTTSTHAYGEGGVLGAGHSSHNS